MDDTHRAYVDEKIIELTTEFKSSCIENFKKCQADIENMQHYVDTEVGRLVTRMDDLESKVNNMENKEEFDPEVSIIATGMPFTVHEDINNKAKQLVRQGLGLREEACPVVRAKRLLQRHDNPRKPPLVKIEFRNKDEKITALRAKSKLKNSPDWERVYIRSSKPHIERLIELNFKIMFGLVNGGNDWKITGSGKLVKKDS